MNHGSKAFITDESYIFNQIFLPNHSYTGCQSGTCLNSWVTRHLGQSKRTLKDLWAHLWPWFSVTVSL